MQFDVRADALTDEVRVWATGELDLAAVPVLRRTLRRAIEPGKTVVVELAGVSLIDSVGLGVLIGADRRLREVGGHLVLHEPDARLRDLFAATRVDELLDVRPSTGTTPVPSA